MAKKFPLKPRPRGARKQSFAQRKEPSSTADKPSVTHGYIKSFDGTKIFYSIEGQGKPLVFCYGLVCSSLHWTYQIEYFRKGYKTIWFDYRGHQNSEVPKNLDSLNVETMAQDLGILLDELKIEDAVLLGHSMGVNVVLEFYRQQPKRVAGMVLANGTPKRPFETLFNSNAAQTAIQLLRKLYNKSPFLCSMIWKLQKDNPISRALVMHGGFNPYLTPPEDVALYVKQVMEMDYRIFLHLIWNYDRVDATSWLHTIQTPTLIIAGEQDKIVPLAQQELMQQLIPNSTLEVIRHGSHCPQMDLPELVIHKIENFLNANGYSCGPGDKSQSDQGNRQSIQLDASKPS